MKILLGYLESVRSFRYAFIALLCIFACLATAPLRAQAPAKTNGVVKTSEKINQSTQEFSEQTARTSENLQQASSNIQQATANIRESVQVFEPILRLRLRKAASAQVNSPAASNNAAANSDAWQQTDDSVSQEYLDQQMPVTVEGPAYNSDGTANLGSQNSKKYGCYLDVVRGAVMDDIDAAGYSQSIDVIFTATDYFNAQVPMYAFLTPAYVKNDAFAYNFFKGVKYKDRNIPPAAWDEVNESEVAMTNLTGEQFERIKTNTQLAAVVKQITGFSQKVESRTKLDGKVLAVKTEMHNRTAYGLIYIVQHYGTTGENGCLKIKIKVTGFDANGDGAPDSGVYQQY